MLNSGFFITLYNVDTLNLYLDRGLYGFLMSPVFGEVSSRSNHYAALADYSCGREGTHVFFFLKRQIVYGGQLEGSNHFGSYYLNGQYSPMGRAIKAPLTWDESRRSCYEGTENNGIFKVTTQSGEVDRCQPYLIRFNDRLRLRGQTISSDELYFELGSYSYPLPSNAIQGMSFCTLTPGEVDILLTKMKESRENIFKETREKIMLSGEPLLFNPDFGIQNYHEASSESHLEASILANPTLFPEVLRPDENWSLCRQIPISPFKPSQMDRADIVYFTDDLIADGTIPNKIIELKLRTAGKNEAEQIVRYVRWLRKIVPKDWEEIEFYLYAPSFTRNIQDHLPNELRYKIKLVPFQRVTRRLDDF